jgi:hypothetical protein
VTNRKPILAGLKVRLKVVAVVVVAIGFAAGPALASSAINAHTSRAKLGQKAKSSSARRKTRHRIQLLTTKTRSKKIKARGGKKKATSSAPSTTTSSAPSTTTSSAPSTTTSAAPSTTTSPAPSTTRSVKATTTSSTGDSSPVQTPTGNGGDVIFDGSDPSSWINQSAFANRTQLVQDPDGGSDDVIRMTADNSDVAPLTPTANPRAQLVSPDDLLVPGMQIWESFDIYLPTDFPVSDSYNGWLALGSPFFGSPYSNTPPEQISIQNGNFEFERNENAPSPWEAAWTMPLVLGRWVRFTWHLDLATGGWAQLYVNDQLQTLNQLGSGYTTLPMDVEDSTNDGGAWAAQLSAYYKLNEYSSVTIYYKDFKIATTQAAAES